ncbi:MaoC/PaaZ C-terminal domain-containing protein [Desertibaculum subflavum]|uniref:MaoC/PaaZ C-terminal domain-containing protein n=1 Tax=Desertibaculum subflavum TaxID=2268458 RepID=UPI0034D24C8F
MAIDHKKLLALDLPAREFSYGEREAMLYAMGIGLGADPMNKAELDFVYEGLGSYQPDSKSTLKTIPSMATVIAWDDTAILQSGINFALVLHGEQRIRLTGPLPAKATILAKTRFVDIFDKGAGKGAILLTETTITEKSSGKVLCVNTSTVFARGDGGFGGPQGSGPAPHQLPERAPDKVVDYASRPDQAILYALSGDRNPLHRDPDVAKAAGFPRPILHGLCTYGHAVRAVVCGMLGHDASGVREIEGRFTAPVFPGETIRTEMWRDGKVISFRTSVTERGLMVINNGKVVA